MKYIIKNCPACCNYAGKYSCEDNHDEQSRDIYCENISDCLLKQIADLCKKYELHDIIALNIMQKLEIEEVNE